LGYLATSDAESDVTFLLSDPDSLQGRQNLECISRSFRDLTWDRQTTDNRQREILIPKIPSQTDAASKTECSHTKCASLITVNS